jgi:low temperature requirement protein LtrA
MNVATDRPSPDREPDAKYEVTPLELFFDLVFVFGVSQLSHHWLEHMTWRGAAEALVLLLPVLAAWSYTSWAATLIPANQSATLWMMLSVMALGLFMNASLTQAFTGSGWLFVVPFLVTQLGRTVWTIANAPDALYREHFIRVLVWCWRQRHFGSRALLPMTNVDCSIGDWPQPSIFLVHGWLTRFLDDDCTRSRWTSRAATCSNGVVSF